MEDADAANYQVVIAGKPLHFPAGLTEEQRTLRSAWIVEAIDRGLPVDVDNAIFTGSMKLANRRISGSFVITNCTVPEIDLSNATFDYIARLDGTSFEADADLHAARFDRDLSLVGVRFTRNADLGNLIVRGNLVCDDATFLGAARFRSSAVGMEASFRRTAFKRDAEFNMMHVANNLICEDITFEGKAVFHRGQIDGDAVYRRITFSGPTSFGRMRVRGDLFMSNPEIVFKDTASFFATEIEGEARFTAVTFHKRWDLRWARFGILTLDEGMGDNPEPRSKQHFVGPEARVDMHGFVCSRMQAYWRPLLSAQDPFDQQPYTELERALRAMARDDLADSVCYRRRQLEGNQRRFRTSPVAWLWDRLFLRAIAGYGVRPGRPLFVVFLLIPMFVWLVFSFSPGAARPASTSASRGSCERTPTWQEAAWLTVRTYSPIEIRTPTGWEPSDCLLGIPGTDRVVLLKGSSFAALVSIAGWILIPFAAVTFTVLLRRNRNDRD